MKTKYSDAVLALVYISAMVVSNYTVMLYGPWFSPINSFLLIGMDLTLRDYWHDRRGFAASTGLVVVAGLVSYCLNPAVAKIAIASTVAFTLSGLVDACVYQLLKGATPLRRINLSNSSGAVVDSIVFPVMAFGGFPLGVIALQAMTKIAGGALWAIIIRDVLKRDAAGVQS